VEELLLSVSDVRQIEIHTAEPLVPDPSPSEFEIGIANLRRYKSAGSEQIPAELIQAGSEALHSEIHKLINSIWNKEELPVQWKESIIVPVHKKCDKTDCSNYRGISWLSTSYKMLSNILLSRLNPYIEEINGYHQCGFLRNRSTTDHIFCIRQMPEKKWKYNKTVYHLIIDFKKTYDSVRGEVLKYCTIFSELGVQVKIVRLIKLCLN
jgi:hypothetical protein